MATRVAHVHALRVRRDTPQPGLVKRVGLGVRAAFLLVARRRAGAALATRRREVVGAAAELDHLPRRPLQRQHLQPAILNHHEEAANDRQVARQLEVARCGAGAPGVRRDAEAFHEVAHAAEARDAVAERVCDVHESTEALRSHTHTEGTRQLSVAEAHRADRAQPREAVV